jgi:hypothetical protein
VGGVGLRLVAAVDAGQLVLFDSFVSVVEEVEHFAGVELGAATDPVAAGGLGGGGEVALGCTGDVVLATLGVGQAEVGHVQTRVDEVVRLFGVGEDGAVEGDGTGAVAGVLGEIGDLDTEEKVVGVLVG